MSILSSVKYKKIHSHPPYVLVFHFSILFHGIRASWLDLVDLCFVVLNMNRLSIGLFFKVIFKAHYQYKEVHHRHHRNSITFDDRRPTCKAHAPPEGS